MSHPSQIMQHALVYAQWAGRQGVASPYLHQTPMAQGRGGSQGAPVRVRQSCQRQTEGRVGAPRVALSSGTERGQGRVQLHPRAQQQQITLEGCQANRLAKSLQRRRRGHGVGCLLQRPSWFITLLRLGRVLGARGVPLQRGTCDGEGRYQVLLVSFVPVRDRRIGHGRVTRGESYCPVASLNPSGLSAPSTCTRAR